MSEYKLTPFEECFDHCFEPTLFQIMAQKETDALREISNIIAKLPTIHHSDLFEEVITFYYHPPYDFQNKVYRRWIIDRKMARQYSAIMRLFKKMNEEKDIYERILVDKHYNLQDFKSGVKYPPKTKIVDEYQLHDECKRICNLSYKKTANQYLYLEFIEAYKERDFLKIRSKRYKNLKTKGKYPDSMMRAFILLEEGEEIFGVDRIKEILEARLNVVNDVF